MRKTGFYLGTKSQHRFSVQQIRFLKLLQLPTLGLRQEVDKELSENPALEEVSDRDKDATEDSLDSPDATDATLSSSSASGAHRTHEGTRRDRHDEISSKISRSEALLSQLSLLSLSKKELLIGKHLIGSLDSEGYLRSSSDSIQDDMLVSHNLRISKKELSGVLEKLRGLEPAGIGASSLSDCLLQQLRRYYGKHRAFPLAEGVLKNHFEALGMRHYDKLKKALGCKEEELKAALSLITRLNPRPGAIDSASFSERVVPDFLLHQDEKGAWVVVLNKSYVPHLRISPTYLKWQKEKKDKEVQDFLQAKVRSAKWWVDALWNREKNLLRAVNLVVSHQSQFLHSGEDAHLKPLFMKQVAEKAGIDTSTVSRIVRGKHIQTPHGVFPLRYFFSDFLILSEEGDVHDKVVKEALRKLIEEEDKKKPLSDERLTGELNRQGFVLARRTVTKYRERMNLPVARLRREI